MGRHNYTVPANSHPPSNHPMLKELNFSPAWSGMKTGVQSVRNVMKTLDSGFLRNDEKGGCAKFVSPANAGVQSEGFIRTSPLIDDVYPIMGCLANFLLY